MNTYENRLTKYLSAVLDAMDASTPWYGFLPAPQPYYAAHVPNIKRSTMDLRDALGVCPFHESKDFLLLIDLRRGDWYCCGKSGGGIESCGFGDMIEFHARLHGIDVNDAVYDLILPWRDWKRRVQK